jgi:N-acetylneuraminic acid mutarotase
MLFMSTTTRLLVVALAYGCTPGARTDVTDGRCEMAAPWATAPDLARGPAQEMAAVAVDGKIYVLGGFQAGGLANVVQVFDTAGCVWSAGPDLPTDVHHPNAAVVDGRIYVVGALRGGGDYMAIGDTWSWNPATDAGWSVRAPMPGGTQRGASATGVIDGKIYVAGGLRYGATTEVSIYDPIADAWTSAPSLPQPRDHACGGVVDGRLYVAGGRNGDPTAPSSLVFELTPGAGWIERAAMPTGRAGAGCGVIADRLIVAGGERNPAPGSRGVFPQVEAYNASLDTWDTLAPMPTPRHGMGVAAWAGRLYTAAGADQQASGAVATHEILTP